MTTNTILTPIYDQVIGDLGFSLEDIIDDRTVTDNARVTPKMVTKRERHKERQRVNRILAEVTAENSVVSVVPSNSSPT